MPALAFALPGLRGLPPWQSAALLAGGLAVAYLVHLAWRFSRADADLELLSKPDPPRGAFTGKVVWLVGASQGLGEALSVQWAKQGARLVLSSRSIEKLQAVKQRCCEFVPASHVELLPLDLEGGHEDLEVAAEEAFAAFDGAGVDYLVHNAGASQHASAEETSAEVSRRLLRLNLLGPVRLARASLPHMLRRGGGRHVAIASMAAVVPSPGQSAYAAAKAGLRAYFLSAAAELADRNVGFTICCPGPLATGLDGKPRLVYKASGLAHAAPSSGAGPSTGLRSRRVPAERAAQLIIRAAYHGLDECWIAQHPVLVLGYVMQYLPSLGLRVLKRVGPGRVRQLREGGSGYDVSAMMRAGGGDAR